MRDLYSRRVVKSIINDAKARGAREHYGNIHIAQEGLQLCRRARVSLFTTLKKRLQERARKCISRNRPLRNRTEREA